MHRAFLLSEPRHGHQARAEEGVRRRAMNHGGARLGQPLAFALGQMDAMGEEAAVAQQAEVIVDVGVVLRPREQLLDEGDLARAFGKMRLHQRAGQRGQQFTRDLELRIRRGGREARGDGVAEPPLAVPFLVKLNRLAGTGLGRVLDGGDGVPVHHGLAGDERHAGVPCGGEERIGTGPVHRAEGECGCGAVLEQPRQEELCGRTGIFAIGVAAFLREGEAGEPVEQVPSRCGEHAVLREVDMGIDEARHDEHVAVVIDVCRLKGLRQQAQRSGPEDHAVIANDDGPPALVHRLAVGGKAQRLALDDARHGDTLSSMRKRKMRQTWASAVANSAAGSLPTRAAKLSRIICLVAPLTAKMKGKPKRCL